MPIEEWRIATDSCNASSSTFFARGREEELTRHDRVASTEHLDHVVSHRVRRHAERREDVRGTARILANEPE